MSKRETNKAIILDGYSINLESARKLANGAKFTVAASTNSKIERSRKLVEQVASSSKPVYGINTGFGFFANKKIESKELREMQRNILISHAGGIGPCLSDEETRLALSLRLNLLLKGFSGARWELCQAIINIIKSKISPLVPEYGSVGASGDLIPLSHLGLPIIGEGKVRYKGEIVSAKKALKAAGLKPLKLAEKEGLSFVNGTEIMQAVGGLALSRAFDLLFWANRIAALSFEGLGGLVNALDPLIHKARGQTGQLEVAAHVLEELKGSYLFGGKVGHSRVQDPYSLRCVAQIHGPSLDALNYVRQVIEREFNAATDNPLVFADKEKIISGGNFHGQALAMAFDFAAIAVAELGNVSERRIELLCNPNMSQLPAFLAPNGGVNSGYMVLQYLAASLVNENKILASPACTDSIPGNVGIEDHVSMGMTSARKFKKIVENTRGVLAAELLAAAQAVDLRKVKKLGVGTKKTYKQIRSKVPTLKEDSLVASDLEAALRLFQV